MVDTRRNAPPAATPLVPCPSCQRHVFAAGAQTCPFCAATLPSDLAARAAPSTRHRLSRAQTFGFNERRSLSAAELAAAAGGAIEDSFDPGSVQPIYGAPVDPYDPGNVHPMYGAPADPWELGGELED